jgi:hypothetical protein
MLAVSGLIQILPAGPEGTLREGGKEIVDMNGFESIFPFVFPFVFVGMWCFVLWVLSFMSGWSELAGRYHFPEKFHGEYYRSQSARLNQANYNRVLEMGVNETGLYLVPMWFFRLFHKPLLVPWGEIHAEPFKKYIFFKGYRLTFRSFPGITLEMQSRAFDKMIEYLKAKTGYQQAGTTPPGECVDKDCRSRTIDGIMKFE